MGGSLPSFNDIFSSDALKTANARQIETLKFKHGLKDAGRLAFGTSAFTPTESEIAGAAAKQTAAVKAGVANERLAVTKKAQETAKDKQRRSKLGRRSTILTGGRGVLDTAAQAGVLGKKKLLGA